MKPKYLFQEAISWLLRLVIGGAVIIGASLHMALSERESTNIILVAVVSAVVLVFGAYTVANLRYCYIDEKGITFFERFKRTSFVSWESITKTEFRQYGRGRGYEEYILVYNDEGFKEPLSPSDINTEGFAHGFRVTFKSDNAFYEQLAYYREDLKRKENI